MADDMPPAHRCRELAVQDRAQRRPNADRAKAALVVGDVRGDRTLEGVCRVGHTVGEWHVDATVTLRRGASIIDEQIRALHRHCNLHGDRLVEPIHMNLVAIGALGELGNRLAHRLL